MGVVMIFKHGKRFRFAPSFNNGENVETYYRQVRSLVESHEDVIEKENCVIIGVKSAKKLIKPGTNQVDFSLKIRSLKEEAKDEDDESGIDD